MPKEDLSLPVEMGRLEIEPVRFFKKFADENPFVSLSRPHQRRRLLNKLITKNHHCSCTAINVNQHTSICKRKHKKIIKEPILRILKSYADKEDGLLLCSKVIVQDFPTPSLYPNTVNVSSLVHNCNQLSISSKSFEKKVKNVDSSECWVKKAEFTSKKHECFTDTSRAGPSCSQEALNPPCDVTIDELASYFETLVHIPKKMSSMAEMMYI